MTVVTREAAADASRIPKSEFDERLAKAQSAIRGRGLDGALIWSRGGGVFDSHWDVFYLSNHYSAFPLVVDLPPHWTGRSHSAIVLPASGDPTLVVDVPDWRRDLVAIDDVRYSVNVVGKVAEIAAERGLAESRLGLVGESAMVASTYRLLLEALPGAEIVPTNDLIENLHVLKSPRELELIREATAIGSQIVDRIMHVALKPGSSEAEAAAAGYELAAREGVAVLQMAMASGPHTYSFTHGGFPGWTKRVLEEGDMFHVDCFAFLNGYQFDFGRACVVGGRPTPRQLEVLECAVEAVDAGIAAIRPGVRANEIYSLVHEFLGERGMLGDGGELTTPSLTLALGMYGHGFGVGWGWPWLSPHDDHEFEASMTLAVEVMPGLADVGAGYFEQDIVITEDGAELLTSTPKRYW